VRHLTGPVEAGFHRVAWDLRYPAPEPTDLEPSTEYAPYGSTPTGPLATPGTYQVSLARRVDGMLTPLAGPVTFSAEILGTGSLPSADRAALLAFQQKAGRLQRAVLGAVKATGEAHERLDHLKQALDDTPGADPTLGAEARALEGRLKDLEVALSGDKVVAGHQEPTPQSIVSRAGSTVSWDSTSAPTGTQRRAYAIAAEQFEEALAGLRVLASDLEILEAKAEAAGAPWTPGRVPTWSPE